MISGNGRWSRTQEEKGHATERNVQGHIHRRDYFYTFNTTAVRMVHDSVTWCHTSCSSYLHVTEGSRG